MPPRQPHAPGAMNETLTPRPLYQQVRELVLRRISEGQWRPGDALPPEPALAAELGVSAGTLRKALDALVADRVIERHRGRGTYVTEHTQERALFQFFRLYREDGSRPLPESTVKAIRRRTVGGEEAARLGLEAGAEVIEIRRTRLIDGIASLNERIVVAAARFPDLDGHDPLPNTLYTLYQQVYGVSVTLAREELRAVAADAGDADLGVAAGTPLLEIRRIAHDLASCPVELRISRCRTERLHYASELG